MEVGEASTPGRSPRIKKKVAKRPQAPRVRVETPPASEEEESPEPPPLVRKRVRPAAKQQAGPSMEQRKKHRAMERFERDQLPAGIPTAPIEDYPHELPEGPVLPVPVPTVTVAATSGGGEEEGDEPVAVSSSAAEEVQSSGASARRSSSPASIHGSGSSRQGAGSSAGGAEDRQSRRSYSPGYTPEEEEHDASTSLDREAAKLDPEALREARVKAAIDRAARALGVGQLTEATREPASPAEPTIQEEGPAVPQGPVVMEEVPPAPEVPTFLPRVPPVEVPLPGPEEMETSRAPADAADTTAGAGAERTSTIYAEDVMAAVEAVRAQRKARERPPAAPRGDAPAAAAGAGSRPSRVLPARSAAEKGKAVVGSGDLSPTHSMMAEAWAEARPAPEVGDLPRPTRSDLRQARTGMPEGAAPRVPTMYEPLPPWETVMAREPPSMQLHRMLKTLSFELATRANQGQMIEDLHTELRSMYESERAARVIADQEVERLNAACEERNRLLEEQERLYVEREQQVGAEMKTLRKNLAAARAESAQAYKAGPQFRKDLNAYGVKCYDLGLQEGEAKLEQTFQAAVETCQRLVGDDRLQGVRYAEYVATLRGDIPETGAEQTPAPPAPEDEPVHRRS